MKSKVENTIFQCKLTPLNISSSHLVPCGPVSPVTLLRQVTRQLLGGNCQAVGGGVCTSVSPVLRREWGVRSSLLTALSV